MRQFKKFTKVIAIMAMLALVVPIALPVSNKEVAQAATTVKLDKKSITIKVGKSATLKVKAPKKNITWSSSDKKVATVNKEGKVTGIGEGKAIITAKVFSKKYTCKVTVVAPENAALKDAPFEAKVVSFGKINAVMPKDWTRSDAQQMGILTVYMLNPISADLTKGSANITVTIQNTKTAAPDYATVTKPYLTENLTATLITSQLKQAGMDAVVSDFATSDYEAKLGTAFKTQYKIDYKNAEKSGSMKQVIYDLYVDTYLVEITVSDNGTAVTPDVYQVGEFVLNSIQITK